MKIQQIWTQDDLKSVTFGKIIYTLTRMVTSIVLSWIKVTCGTKSKMEDMPFFWDEKHKTSKKQGY
jgi:hypothetical protein